MLDPAETAGLVRRAQRGDAGAFSTLVRNFLRAAYSVALAIVHRPADAEDVAQDSFVAALGQLGTCREPERFAGWLLQIVRNRARNWLEKRRLRDVPAETNTREDTVPAAAPEQAGLKQRLLSALTCVSPLQREIVLLHDLEEWTHAEISAALEISEVMSRQHLFNARRILREILAEPSSVEVGA